MPLINLNLTSVAPLVAALPKLLAIFASAAVSSAVGALALALAVSVPDPNKPEATGDPDAAQEQHLAANAPRLLISATAAVVLLAAPAAYFLVRWRHPNSTPDAPPAAEAAAAATFNARPMGAADARGFA